MIACKYNSNFFHFLIENSENWIFQVKTSENFNFSYQKLQNSYFQFKFILNSNFRMFLFRFENGNFLYQKPNFNGIYWHFHFTDVSGNWNFQLSWKCTTHFIIWKLIPVWSCLLNSQWLLTLLWNGYQNSKFSMVSCAFRIIY